MSLDEIRQAHRREKGERGPGVLKPIPKDFYVRMGKYINNLKEERSEIPDHFSNQARKLDRETSNAIDSLEGLFKIRIGKIMDLASITVASTRPIKEYTDAMTPEEQRIYQDLVEALRQGRKTILEPILSSKPSGSPLKPVGKIEEKPAEEALSTPPDAPKPPDDMRKNDIVGAVSVVHILQGVPTFKGVDGREYKLSSNDVVTLPKIHAKGLCDRKAAQEININKVTNK